MYFPQTYRGKPALCAGACRGVEAGTGGQAQNGAVAHGDENITNGGEKMKKVLLALTLIGLMGCKQEPEPEPQYILCPNCNGRGWVTSGITCYICRGEGKINLVDYEPPARN